MSFRYTNNLVATLKHRLSLEAAHRHLVRQTFTGTCNGIEVTCTGYGSVIGIRLLEKAVWEPQYRVDDVPQNAKKPSPDGDRGAAGMTASSAAAAAPSQQQQQHAFTAASATPVASATAKEGIDLVKLSASIQAATWQAIHKIRAAKEDAHGRALRHNPQLRSDADLRHWYEEDANTLQPLPCDALKNLTATPWMQAVKFGVPQPARFLQEALDNNKNEGGTKTAAATATITALSDADSDPANIPIGSAHPLFIPGLVQLELDPNLSDATAATSAAGSRVDAAFVLSEQRKEMRGNEEAFWERVELVRRSQLAAIPKGVKRNYADMSATLQDNTEEKVRLRFVQ